MRPTLALAFAITLCACGSQTPETAPPPTSGADATVVDPTYCTKYCEAQANNGTITGTLKQCEQDCCGRVPAGCSGDGGGTASDGGGAGDGGAGDGATPPGDGGSGSDASDGSSCPSCGSVCCKVNEACVQDTGGNPTCVATCTTATDCPDTKCCAPATNAAGDPVGPYVCKPDDGQAYDCCNGTFTTCGTGFCCVDDSAGNQFCAKECASNTGCGAAKCEGFTFSHFHTTCSGPTACGP